MARKQAIEKQATTLVTPTQVPFWDTARGRALKRLGWMVVAAIVSGGIAILDQDRALLGPMTPILYFALTTARDFTNPRVQN